MGTRQQVGFAIAPGDGTPLCYAVCPSAEPSSGAPAVALCDGIGCDGYVWRYLTPSLARHHRVVHWHYPGHGRTPMPRDRERVAITDLADDLAAILDDTGDDRAVLIGHSMGVQVALETYRRHPERVAALVLMCGAPGTPLNTFKGSALGAKLLPLLRMAVGRAPGLFNGLWRALVPTDLAHWVSERSEINGLLLEKSDFRPYLEGLARIDISLFLSMLAKAQVHDAMGLLPNIAVPTLIIAGDRDGFTPASLSQKMHEQIPGAELLLIEGGSHTAPLERPHLVDETVLDFLSRRLSQ